MGGARHFEITSAPGDAPSCLALMRRVIAAYPTKIEEIILSWESRRPEVVFRHGSSSDTAILTTGPLPRGRFDVRAHRALGLTAWTDAQGDLVVPTVIGSLDRLRGLPLSAEPGAALDARLRFPSLDDPRLEGALLAVGGDRARLAVDLWWRGAVGGYNEIALQRNARRFGPDDEPGASQVTIAVNYKTDLSRVGLDDPGVDQSHGDASDLARRIARAAGVEVLYLGTE